MHYKFFLLLIISSLNGECQVLNNQQNEFVNVIQNITTDSYFYEHMLKYSKKNIPRFFNENAIFIKIDNTIIEGINKLRRDVDSTTLYFFKSEDIFFYDVNYYINILEFNIDKKNIIVKLLVVNTAAEYSELPFIYAEYNLKKRNHKIYRRNLDFLSKEEYEQKKDILIR